MLTCICIEKKICAFIDYRKTFDSVNRIALWKKLIQQNINGKMLRVVHSMYNNAIARVRQNSKLSFFLTNVGVRQGENLSPILFSFFLNDLVDFISRGYDGLTDITNTVHLVFDNADAEVYFKLFLLLYADNTVVLAESKEQIQVVLNSIYFYCQTWRLEVNPSKTKVVNFQLKKGHKQAYFHL